MSAVEQVATVAEGYVHVPKVVSTQPGIELQGAQLKWYDIAADDTPIPLAIRALARRNLRDSANAGELGLSGDLGFVILHRCGESFYFLLVSTWRNDNELWETVWAKNGESDFAFRPWPLDGTHRPTFCVWELGAVCHEQRAWTAFLCTDRTVQDRAAYLQSSFEGVVSWPPSS